MFSCLLFPGSIVQVKKCVCGGIAKFLANFKKIPPQKCKILEGPKCRDLQWSLQ